MLNIAFWNIGRNPLQNLLSALVTDHIIDLLILAETNMPAVQILSTLNAARPAYYLPWSSCKRLSVFTRFDPSFLEPRFESERISIRLLSLPARETILLALAHLTSKLHFDEDSQRVECNLLSARVLAEEERVGHTRTVLVGDFNVNPFERSVAGTFGLHAVMTKEIATRKRRTVQGKTYPFFYNPMWRHFGDRSDGPPGTFYYEKAEHTTYFWNIFDQVLVRPDLIRNFPDDELRILTAVGGVNLLDGRGRPDPKVASDHLPVFFRLDL